jgi:hypothetical protein
MCFSFTMKVHYQFLSQVNPNEGTFIKNSMKACVLCGEIRKFAAHKRPTTHGSINNRFN